LKDKGEILDENLYWLSDKPRNYEQLNDLAETKIKVTLERTTPGKTRVILDNPGSETAFFMRLKVLDSALELVLPVFFSDNYISIFPGESKTVELDYAASVQFTQGEKKMKLALEGWNVPYQETGL